VTIEIPRGGLKINNYLKIRIIILSALFIFYSPAAFAESGFDFYFFGQNINAYQNSNWIEVTAGAVASLCIHELGHALYLESIGKSWEFQVSAPSGFAVHTADNLADDESSILGRAGFALQTLIGTGLTLFEETRHSDFTKGWVGMTAAQVLSYRGRRHDNGDDFELIERGGGDNDLELAGFSILSMKNLIRSKNDRITWVTPSEPIPDDNLSYDFSEPENGSNDFFFSNTDRRQSFSATSDLELPPPVSS
jgi:hypothetical protein